MPLDFQTRAAFQPKTVNRKSRTVDVVLSSGAPVQRHSFEGPFTEQLEITTAAVDLTRMPVSLLDGHRQDGIDSILGTLISARAEGGQLIGTVRISKRHKELLDDIEAGDIRSVSIGYTVEKYDEHPGENGQKIRTATKWTLVEASFVSVPADPQATVRSHTMTTPNTTTTPEPAPTPPPAAVQTRADANAEIRALATTLDLPHDFANGLIDREATVDEARAAAISQVQTRTTRPSQHVTAMHQIDSPEAIVTRMGEAQFARANPAHTPSDAARQYMNLTTLDVARDCLTRSGHNIVGIAPAEVITRALHSTSDFPMIFGDTVNRSLRAGYDAAPDTLKIVGKRTTARDFRAKTSIQMGEAPTLEPVTEGGEFKSGTMAEAKESYAIDSFGKIIGFTRKAMVNDDLGALNDLAGKWGQAAVEFEAQFLVDLLVANSGAGPNMDDGDALFHTSHSNLAASGGVISEATLNAARVAMRTQKGLSGTPINATPKYVIVPPQLELAAEKIMTAIQPTASADVNPFAGKLVLLVEARLTDANRWYLAADPAMIEGLEYAYLQGEEGPQVETKAGFEVDGVQLKVRLDFGAAFLDHRSWYMNPGA